MPILDSCHFQVVNALRKGGWKVSDKPIYIDADTPVYIDIAAVKVDGVGNVSQQFYAEVKCFPGKNFTQELYIAIGQYTVYRTLLAIQQLSIPLYLAIPSTIVKMELHDLIVKVAQDNRIKLLLIDLEKEVIDQWIE